MLKSGEVTEESEHVEQPSEDTEGVDDSMEELGETFADIKPFDMNPKNTGIQVFARTSAEITKQELMYYDATGDKYLVIFNQHKFKKTQYYNYRQPSTRIGTNEDVSRLTGLFERMNYKVTVHHDLDCDDILDEVIKISNQDHKTTSCLCIVILTHGEKGGELFAADRSYQLTDITVPLENGHDSLVGKPKLLFIQACRGKSVDCGRRIELDGQEASVVIPSHADFLILYSTVEDFISYRDRDGSFLIQELCDVIEEYHTKYDILHITTLVHMRVAYYRSTYAPKNLVIHDKKQMPETRYSLTKLFMF